MKLSLYDNSAFDRGAPRWKEVLWRLAGWIFFRGAFPWPSGLRVAWLRVFGAKVGARVVIRSLVDIHFPWRLETGDDVWIGDGVRILNLAPVRIGSDVCVSQDAFLCTGSHNFVSETFDLVAAPIVVGGGSWVAARAFIGPGVSVGPGSMVAAGAVVLRDVATRTMAGGNPARKIKNF